MKQTNLLRLIISSKKFLKMFKTDGMVLSIPLIPATQMQRDISVLVLASF